MEHAKILKQEELYRVEEIILIDGDKKIYGLAYIPNKEGKKPLVIYSHEMCYSHNYGIPYAQRLAKNGYAAYTFDFRGGAPVNRSNGSSLEMTMLTEVEDLKMVLSHANNWDFVDPSHIYLLGASLGGVVSAITAAQMAEQIAGLILLYPAFPIVEEIHDTFGAKENIPEEYMAYGWMKVSKKYALDIWDIDVYETIVQYQKKVLILHGDRDETIPLEFSCRAQREYKDAQLFVLPGAGHIFQAEYVNQAFDYIKAYLDERTGRNGDFYGK